MERGVVVLVRQGTEVARWPLEVPGTRVDLGIVARLARAQLFAKRAGCEVRLAQPCPVVRGLLDLVGLGDWIEVER